MQIYGLLKFTTGEANRAFNEFGALIQIAVSAELLRDLSEDEVLNVGGEFPDKAPDEQKEMVMGVFRGRYVEEEASKRIVKATANAARKYFDYLRGRGNEDQKLEINQLLSEMFRD
jgi:hypothetical protein